MVFGAAESDALGPNQLILCYLYKNLLASALFNSALDGLGYNPITCASLCKKAHSLGCINLLLSGLYRRPRNFAESCVNFLRKHSWTITTGRELQQKITFAAHPAPKVMWNEIDENSKLWPLAFHKILFNYGHYNISPTLVNGIPFAQTPVGTNVPIVMGRLTYEAFVRSWDTNSQVQMRTIYCARHLLPNPSIFFA